MGIKVHTNQYWESATPHDRNGNSKCILMSQVLKIKQISFIPVMKQGSGYTFEHKTCRRTCLLSEFWTVEQWPGLSIIFWYLAWTVFSKKCFAFLQIVEHWEERIVSTICQYLLGLAIAEQSIGFEHRDMHSCNVSIGTMDTQTSDRVQLFRTFYFYGGTKYRQLLLYRTRIYRNSYIPDWGFQSLETVNSMFCTVRLFAYTGFLCTGLKISVPTSPV